MHRWNSILAAIVLAMLPAPVVAQEQEQVQEQVDRAELALMGTVPIYWGEAAGLHEVLNGDAPAHWARGVLEADFALVPLDYLSSDALAAHRFLLMAQPRGLSAEENVALDAWVRSGGTLLLFADPMMTGESRFHLGDRRRPQDVSLLSPLLTHWGLDLHFDPSQPAGPQVISHFGDGIPVNLRGELRHAQEGEPPYCVIPESGLLAHCVIEMGQAMIVADAAMLDIAEPQVQAEAALRHLVEHIFADFGDDAGNGAQDARDSPDISDNPGGRQAEHGQHYHESDANTVQ